MITESTYTYQEFEAGWLETVGGNKLPLQHVKAVCDVHGLYTTWKITQTFLNPLEETVEVIYTFPLPGRFKAQKFVLTHEGKRIKGTLKERGQAQTDYNNALASGATAGLLEEERVEVFTVSLGNINAGATAETFIELTGPVTVSDRQGELRLPTVVGERYVDGLTEGTQRVVPPRVENSEVDFSIKATFTKPVSLDVPEGFAVVKTKAGKTKVKSPDGFKGTKDAVIRFDVDDLHVMQSESVSVDEGYVTALTIPGWDNEETEPTGRNVIVLLDRSGSMTGEPFEIATRAAGRLLDSLCENDRLNLVAFDHETDALWEELQEGTDANRFQAVQFGANLQPRGGTALSQGLEVCEKMFATTDQTVGRENVLIVITDALVGDETGVLRAIGPLEVTYHVVCIGQNANRGLADRLSDATGGTTTSVDTPKRLDETLESLKNRVSAPLWKNIKLYSEKNGKTKKLQQTTPRHKTVHHNQYTTIFGWSKHQVDTLIVEKTNRNGETKTFTVEVSQTDNKAIVDTWARSRVRDLEDLRAIGGDSRVVEAKEIVEFSLAWNVLCSYTAFVAVDEAGEEPQNVAKKTLTQPLGLTFPRGGGMTTNNMVGQSRQTTNGLYSRFPHSSSVSNHAACDTNTYPQGLHVKTLTLGGVHQTWYGDQQFLEPAFREIAERGVLEPEIKASSHTTILEHGTSRNNNSDSHKPDDTRAEKLVRNVELTELIEKLQAALEVLGELTAKYRLDGPSLKKLTELVDAWNTLIETWLEQQVKKS